MDFGFEIIGKTHYSIDVWVGFLLTSAVWKYTDCFPRVEYVGGKDVVRKSARPPIWVFWLTSVFFSAAFLWSEGAVFVCALGLVAYVFAMCMRHWAVAEHVFVCCSIFGLGTFV